MRQPADGMSDIERTLHDLERRFDERGRLTHRLEAAGSRVEALRSRRARLAEVLQREEADVATLEGLTLTALFRTMFADKAERVAKEREEALRARLEYQSCAESLELAEAEFARLTCGLEEFAGLDAQLAAAEKAKEVFLLGLRDSRGEELLRLAERRARLAARAARLREAQRCGMTAYTSIEELNAELLGAQAASNWDVLGGHVLATALKRSRVGGARAIAEQVEDDLHSFAVELASIGVAGETLPDLDINIPHHFADYLLDCLIIDWKVHGKIKEASARTREAMELIREIVEHLETRVKKLAEESKELAARRTTLLRT